jgi:LPS-assembly protein
MVHDDEHNLLLAIGSAELTYGGIYVTADYLEYGFDTDEVVAVGNVIVEDADNRIFADSLELNVDTKVGVIYRADGILAGVFYFSGTRLVKLSEDKFQVFDGYISACAGDRPPWAFRCERATVEIEEFAVVHHPTFRIENLPAAYLPYFVFPAKKERATGFLFPGIGMSSRDGFTLENAFFWAIAVNQDATFGLDYLANRGLRPRAEYRYIFSPRISGQLNASYLQDQDTDEKYHKVLYTHRHDFPGDVRSNLRLESESEDSGIKEFERNINIRSRRATDSSLVVSKNFENRSIQLRARWYDSIQQDFDQKFGRLPEITFKNSAERIRNTPIFFKMDSSLINFVQETGVESADVARLDVWPRVSLPMTKYPYLTVTPELGFRETYYSKQRTDSDGVSRELGMIRVNVNGPLLERVYQRRFGRVNKFKHRIEPSVRYEYDDYMFGNDREEMQNVHGFASTGGGRANRLTYAFVNRFLAQEIGEDGSLGVREIARLTINQGFDIEETRREGEGESRPFSDVGIDLETRLWPNFIFNLDSSYDVYDNTVDSANLEIGLALMDRFTVQFDKRYTRPAGTFTSVGASYRILDRWRVAFESRYDGRLEEFVQNVFELDYTGQCWGIRWQLVDRREETSIAFLISLKELGSIGTPVQMRVGPRL